MFSEADLEQMVYETIEKNGVYVRKTFSIGESDDKRFYLEARRITED
jgi:hypothetical protein